MLLVGCFPMLMMLVAMCVGIEKHPDIDFKMNYT